MTADLDLVERAVDAIQRNMRSQSPRLSTANCEQENLRILCAAATRAAELERENEVLREQNIELNDGCVALERERDAAMARIGELEQQSEHWEASFNGSTAEIERLQEVERELAEAQDYIEKVLHRCGEFSAERDAALARVGEVERELNSMSYREAKAKQERDLAEARAEELTTDLHEMREAAEWRAEMVQLYCDAARQYAAERDQLRAELDAEQELANDWHKVADDRSREINRLIARLAAAEGALDRLLTAACEGVVVGEAYLDDARAALAPSTGEQHRLVLSSRDAERVLDALERPAELSPALAEAADRYKAKIASGELVSDAGERQEGE